MRTRERDLGIKAEIVALHLEIASPTTVFPDLSSLVSNLLIHMNEWAAQRSVWSPNSP